MGLREVFVEGVEEKFADVCGYCAVEGRVKPDDVALSVSLFLICVGGGVVG